jgi:DNA-binding MarR family transcriptional regulator
MGDVATEFQITKASVNALINRLCRDGWLTRTQDRKDRRITHLHLSKTAEKKIQTTLKRKRSIAAAALASLAPQDQKNLQRILRTMLETLNQS